MKRFLINALIVIILLAGLVYYQHYYLGRWPAQSTVEKSRPGQTGDPYKNLTIPKTQPPETKRTGAEP